MGEAESVRVERCRLKKLVSALNLFQHINEEMLLLISRSCCFIQIKKFPQQLTEDLIVACIEFL